MNKRNGLIIFSKYPQYGKVKTRLAATIGNEKAIKFYNVCAKHLFDAAAALNGDTEIFLYFYPQNELKKIKEWVSKDFNYLPQSNGDLGTKMNRSFNEAFAKGMEKVVIVGTDIPDVDSELLKKAFDELERHDVVIGPTYDGGYYLLGLKKPVPSIFRNIEWSTHHVFDQTLKKLRELGLKPKLLNKLHDIDTELELLNWLKSKKGDTNFKESLRKAVFGD